MLEVDGHNVTVGREFVKCVTVNVPAPETEGSKILPETPVPNQTPKELVEIETKSIVGFETHCGIIELVKEEGINCSTFITIESRFKQPLFEAKTYTLMEPAPDTLGSKTPVTEFVIPGPVQVVVTTPVVVPVYAIDKVDAEEFVQKGANELKVVVNAGVTVILTVSVLGHALVPIGETVTVY